jgi:hypothetical protein
MEQAVHSVEWQHFTGYTITDLTNNKYNINKKIWIRYRQTRKLSQSVPDPPARNLGDGGFQNPESWQINLGAERCCYAAQTVSDFPSTANSARGNWQQLHGGGRNWKGITGWTENRDKRKGMPQPPPPQRGHPVEVEDSISGALTMILLVRAATVVLGNLSDVLTR